MKRFAMAQLASFASVFFAILLTGGTLFSGPDGLIGIVLIVVIIAILSIATFVFAAVLTSEAMEIKQAVPIAIVTVLVTVLALLIIMGMGHAWLSVLEPLGDATIGWIAVAFIGGLLSYWWQTPDRVGSRASQPLTSTVDSSY